MKRKQYREEKFISILKEHEAGASVPDLARRHGVAGTRSIGGSRSSAAWTYRKCPRHRGRAARLDLDGCPHATRVYLFGRP